MRRSKNYFNPLYGGDKVMKRYPEYKDMFIKALVEAIVHARKVCRREKHLDCANERIGMFVVSLRRSLSLIGYDRDVAADLCQYNRWFDAGVPNHRCDRKYTQDLEEAVMQANSKEKQSMDDLTVVLEKEEALVIKMKEVNKEADQLFADIKQLVSGL